MSYDDFERENDLKDKELSCVDCGNVFIYTSGEQEFFKSKEMNPPKRCKECRVKKKASYAAQDLARLNNSQDTTGRERY